MFRTDKIKTGEILLKKIGIIGKDSFIGANLFDFLVKTSKYNVVGTTINTLDITSSDDIKNFVKTENCDVIILLAGSKNVKELESDLDYAYKINVEPVKNFVENITNERFVYMSSDYVYNGNKGMYDTSDAVCPDTVYGKNKVQAENIIRENCKNYGIVRTAGVLGNKSVFLNWLINTFKTEKQVEMFDNSYFTPTCVTFLCEAIEQIINDNENKIYHAVQEKRLSRYELACIVKNMIKSECEIIPVKTSCVDRSLEQCDFIKRVSKKTFEDYLKDILCTN